MNVEPGPDLVPFSDVLAAVREEFPELSIQRAIFQQAPGHAYVFRLKPRDGGLLWLATADPYTGNVLGGAPIVQFPFEAALYLHAELLSGKLGSRIVGFMGLALLVMAVSGVYLWWPRHGGFRQAIRIGRSRQLSRFLLGLHKVPGIFVAFFLIVQSVTGSMISFRPDIAPFVGLFAEVEVFPTLTPTGASDQPERRAEHLIELAKLRFPDSRLRDMRFVGGDPAEVVGITFYDDSHPRPRAVDSAWFDTSSGEILHTVTAQSQAPGNQFLRWMLPIHNGRYLGMGGRIFAVLVGLSLLLLVTTGVWLWTRRRQTHGLS